MNLEKIDGVKFVVPMDYGMVSVEYRGEKAVLLHAANWKNYAQVLESFQGIKLEEGQWPIDEITSRPCLVMLPREIFF